MDNLDAVEKRLAELGVNVYDLPEVESNDAYARAKKQILRDAELIDRMETRIHNLLIANEYYRNEWSRLMKQLAQMNEKIKAMEENT